MDQVDVITSLADLETKRAIKKQELETKIQNQTEVQQTLVTSNQSTMKKIQEEADRKIQELKEQTEAATTHHEQSMQALRDELKATMEHYDRQSTILTEKAAPLASAMVSSVSNCILIPVAPGSIVHSNNITEEAARQSMTLVPEMNGMSEQYAQACLKWMKTLLSLNSMEVAPTPQRIENVSNGNQTDGASSGASNLERQSPPPAAAAAVTEGDDLSTDEEMDEDEKAAAEANAEERGDQKPVPKRIKKSAKAKAAANKGSGLVRNKGKDVKTANAE